MEIAIIGAGNVVYFARDAPWQSETGGSWTAVSRAPWLRAVTLWAKGDCWQGGGLFLDGRRYWLNGCHRGLLLEESNLSCVADPPTGGFGAECLSVYYPRLLRDGWKLAEPINRAGWIDRFEKPLAHGWTLVKLAHRSANPPPGRGCYWDEHLLLHAGSDTVLAYPDWEWAESDPAGVPPPDSETPDCDYAARGIVSIRSRRNWAGERCPCLSISQFSL